MVELLCDLPVARAGIQGENLAVIMIENGREDLVARTWPGELSRPPASVLAVGCDFTFRRTQ